MRTKNQIIEELFKSREFNECIDKMHPEHLRNDLRSEVILILCEKSEETLQTITEQGGLKFYTVRIILNLIQSKTSSFHKKFRLIHHQYDPLNRRFSDEFVDQMNDMEALMTKEDTHELTERERRELMEDMAMDHLESLDHYEREIVKLYLRLGSYRKIEKETYNEALGMGIPWESCYSTVQRAIKKIRNELNPI